MKRELANRIVISSVLIFFALSFFITPVAAQSSTTDILVGGVTNILDFIREAGDPIFRALLGETTTGGDLFTKVLVFLLVLLIVSAILGSVDMFAERKWLQVSVGAIISIIGIRFMPPGIMML